MQVVLSNIENGRGGTAAAEGGDASPSGRVATQ